MTKLKATYVNKPGPDSPMEERIAHGRLDSFMKQNTSFNVRWKTTWHRDYSSPAVFSEELNEKFSRKEIKLFLERGWLKKDAFRDFMRGGHRAAFVFIGKLLPQINPWKKRFTWIEEHGRYPIVLALLMFLVILLMVLIPYRAVHAFGPGPVVNSPYKGEVPGSLAYPKIHKFVDTVENVTCYWVEGEREKSISCLHGITGNIK